MLFEIADELDGDDEIEFVFDVDIDEVIVELDVIDFEFVFVFVSVLEDVDVFELEIEPENEEDPLGVFEFLLDNVELTDPVELEESVCESVDILVIVKSGGRVDVIVTVCVIYDDKDGIIVLVILAEADEVLLFFDEVVSVIVLILDELEHGLPLEVFVWGVVLLSVVDDEDVLLWTRVDVTE
jgi:hypothetical protein